MIINERDIGLIEAFIDGRLQDEELEVFQQRLKTDEGLARLLKTRTQMAGLLKEASEYEKLKNQIGAVIQKEKDGFYQTYKYYILPIAASILIIVGIYIVIQFQNVTNDNNIHLAETSDTTSALKIDEPNVYAKKYMYDSLELLAPVQMEKIAAGEIVQLKWRSSSEHFGTLYVIDKNNQVVIEKRVKLANNGITLETKDIKPGNYKWCLNKPSLQDTAKMGSFVIVK